MALGVTNDAQVSPQTARVFSHLASVVEAGIATSQLPVPEDDNTATRPTEVEANLTV